MSGAREEIEVKARVETPDAVRRSLLDAGAEVEGPPAAIERAIAATGMTRDAFLPGLLRYFERAYEERTGRPARVAGKTP